MFVLLFCKLSCAACTAALGMANAETPGVVGVAPCGKGDARGLLMLLLLFVLLKRRVLYCCELCVDGGGWNAVDCPEVCGVGWFC